MRLTSRVFTYEEPVLDVISSKFPVSLQFGIINLILTYIVCIILGVIKAIKNGTKFDLISSVVLFVMYAIPGFMLGILLIQFFCIWKLSGTFSGSGLYGDDYEYLSFTERLPIEYTISSYL